MPGGAVVAVKRLSALGRSGSAHHDYGFSAEIQTLSSCGCSSSRPTARPTSWCTSTCPTASSARRVATRYKIAVEAAMYHDCSPPTLHSDVESNSILLDTGFEAHAADFNLAKFLNGNAGACPRSPVPMDTSLLSICVYAEGGRKE